MKHTTIRLSLIGTTGLLPIVAQADLVNDSQAVLEMKNYYFNRDFEQGSGQSRREEWAQGFALNVQSGFTEGTIGVGLDAVGMLGLKLDSSPARSGTGLLSQAARPEPGSPRYARRAHDNYTKLGLTAKARVADSELRVGHLQPDLPLLQPNTSRLFPQTFRGAQLTSGDINDLTLRLGEIDRVKQRDSTDYEKLGLNAQNGSYKSSARSDQFRYAGVDYQITPNMIGSYQHAQLQNIYQQHYLGLKHSLKTGPGTLKSELRYFDSSQNGAGLAGRVDNRALSSRMTYSWLGHSLGGGYQRQFGDTAFTYVNGSNTYLFTDYQLNNFSNAGERAWHARYDYNFAEIGVPGLLFSTRYAKGKQARVAGFAGEGREWERDVDLSYTLQSGPFKDVSMRWRTAQVKSNYQRDSTENRLLLSHAVKLW